MVLKMVVLKMVVLKMSGETWCRRQHPWGTWGGSWTAQAGVWMDWELYAAGLTVLQPLTGRQLNFSLLALVSPSV